MKIKEIPAKYLYRVVDRRAGVMASQVPLLSVSISRGVIRRDEITDKEARADDLVNYKLCAARDIVINRMSAYQGALGISPIAGLVSPDYLVLRAGPEIEPRFLTYLFRSTRFVGEMTARLRGIGSTEQGNVRTPRINEEDLGRICVGIPSYATQRAIADYLDYETTRIDALIAAKRRLGGLLDEHRVASAHATITGVQLPGPRRSSPVAWLGSLPSHWQIASLGSLFDVRLGRMLNAERSVGSHMRPYIRNVNVRWDYVDLSDLAEMDFPPAERGRYLLRAGDLLVNEGDAGIGRATIWREQIPEIYYQKSVHRIRPRGALSVRWLLEWMRVAVDRNVFQVEGNLATIPHVPAEALRRYPVPLPPIPEAEALLVRLEQTLERDSALSRANESQVTLLQERRQALITAAVTGQLDIPEAA